MRLYRRSPRQGTVLKRFDCHIIDARINRLPHREPKLDRDGDGVLNYAEVCDCFIPRESEYATMINSRGGFYGGEHDS